MRIAICDDSHSEQEQFIKALHGWDASRTPERFSDGASFLAAAKETPHFDIVFLDIYMPGENGVDIGKELQKLSPETGIVFVTTSEEHAVDAFSLHALSGEAGNNGAGCGSFPPSDAAPVPKAFDHPPDSGAGELHGISG